MSLTSTAQAVNVQTGDSTGIRSNEPAASRTADARSTTRRSTRLRFPTPATTGVPNGWVPRRTIRRDVVVRRAGRVIRGLRIIGGDLIVKAPNVTVARVEIVGGVITNRPGSRCHNGLRIRRTTIRPGAETHDYDEPVIGIGGYTARRVELHDVPEGFRVGGRSDGGCGPVRIVNTWARVKYPDVCRDWHGDGIQGYDGPRLTVRNSVMILKERPGCGGTAPFFYPSGQGNASVDIDRLIVKGGGYAFRLGRPGSVTNLKIVRNSWYYGPIDVRCSSMRAWSAQIVRVINKGTRTRTLRNLRCNTEGGS